MMLLLVVTVKLRPDGPVQVPVPCTTTWLSSGEGVSGAGNVVMRKVTSRVTWNPQAAVMLGAGPVMCSTSTVGWPAVAGEALKTRTEAAHAAVAAIARCIRLLLETTVFR